MTTHVARPWLSISVMRIVYPRYHGGSLLCAALCKSPPKPYWTAHDLTVPRNVHMPTLERPTSVPMYLCAPHDQCGETSPLLMNLARLAPPYPRS